MASLNSSLPTYLDKFVAFPDGTSYEILHPLTDLRKCHDGRPLESRILFACRKVIPEPGAEHPEEFVMKVKVQAPDRTGLTEQLPVEGPSSTTEHELCALKIFTQANSIHSPHLVSFMKTVQGSKGVLPGGYLTYLVMTKMPGQDLLAFGYWKLTDGEREDIMKKFIEALRATYNLGIEPVDCALRNVLWEAESRKCTIIDFELWRPTTESFPDEKKELERWGLAKRKPPISWWAEWNMQGR